MTKFVRFLRDNSGATAIEYALIAAGIALALVTILPQINTKLAAVFGSINSAL